MGRSLKEIQRAKRAEAERVAKYRREGTTLSAEMQKTLRGLDPKSEAYKKQLARNRKIVKDIEERKKK